MKIDIKSCANSVKCMNYVHTSHLTDEATNNKGIQVDIIPYPPSN